MLDDVTRPNRALAGLVVIVVAAFAGAQEDATPATHREQALVTDFESGPIPQPDRGDVSWIDDAPDGTRALRWTLRRDREAFARLRLPIPERDCGTCGALAFWVRTDRPLASGKVVVQIPHDGDARLWFRLPALPGDGQWRRVGLPVDAFAHIGKIDPGDLREVWLEVHPPDGTTTIDFDRVAFLGGGRRWLRRRPEPIDFEDPLRMPHVDPAHGSISIEREEDGSGHFGRWQTGRHGTTMCFLNVRPLPSAAEDYGILALRLRASEPTRNPIRVWIGSARGGSVSIDVAPPGSDWTDYRIPLAFAQSWDERYGGPATYIGIGVVTNDRDIAIDIDDVHWTGRRGWVPRRRPVTTFAKPGDVESALGWPRGVERAQRDNRWGIAWTAPAGEPAELRLRCAPFDLRPYKAITLHLWSAEPVALGQFQIVFREDPECGYGLLGEIRCRIPPLERGWNAVHIPFERMHCDEYATFACVSEIGIRRTRRRLAEDRTLVVGGLDCIEGPRRGTRWTKAIDERIWREVRRGDDGAETVARVLHTFRGTDGIDVRLSIVQSLRALGPRGAARLIPLVVDPSLAVQVRASFALQRLGPRAKSIVPALVAAIGTNEEDVAHEAFHVLLRLGPDGERALVDLALNEAEAVREGVAHAIRNESDAPESLLGALAKRFTADTDAARATRVGEVLAGVGDAGRAALRDALPGAGTARRMLGLRLLGKRATTAELIATMDGLPLEERVQIAIDVLASRAFQPRGSSAMLQMIGAGKLPRRFLEGRVPSDASNENAEYMRRALAVVIEAIEGDETAPRTHALQAMTRLPYVRDDLLPSVIRGFPRFTTGERLAALTAIATIDAPEPELSPVFEHALGADDAPTRARAMQALAENRRLALLFPDLVARGIGDDDATVRMHAVDAASSLRRPSSEIERALSALIDADPATEQTYRALVAMRGVARYESPDAAKRRAAEGYRAWVAKAEAVCRNRLGGAATDRERVEALDRLIGTVGHDAIPLLCAQLDDEKTEFVAGVAERLVALGDPSALDALRARLDHPTLATRAIVMAAIVAIAPDGGAADVRRAIAKAEPEELVALLSLLSTMRVPDTGSAIAETLTGGDFRIRFAALNALTRNGSSAHVPAILRLLDRLRAGPGAANRFNAYVRIGAMQTIGRLDAEGQAETLRAFLDNDASAQAIGGDPRQAFVDTLVRIQDPATRATLVKAEIWFPVNWYVAPAAMRRLDAAEIPAAECTDSRWADLLPRIADAIDVEFHADVPIRGWTEGTIAFTGGFTTMLLATGRSRPALELLAAYAEVSGHIVLVEAGAIRVVDEATGIRRLRAHGRRDR